MAFSWSASSLKFNQLTADNEPALDTIGWMQGLFRKVYSPIRYLYRLFQNIFHSLFYPTYINPEFVLYDPNLFSIVEDF